MNNIYDGIEQQQAVLLGQYLDKMVDEVGRYVMDWENLILVARWQCQTLSAAIDNGAGKPAEFALEVWVKVLRLTENEVLREIVSRWRTARDEAYQQYLDYGAERVIAMEPTYEKEDAKAFAFLAFEAWKSEVSVQ